MNLRRSAVASVLTLVCCAIVPSLAAAATRYAAPGGSTAGTCSSPAAACSIEHAVNDAGAGDVVRLAAGTYTTGTPLLLQSGVSVLPDDTASRPRLVSTAPSAAVSLSSTQGAQTRFSGVDVDHTATSAAAISASGSGALVDHVRVVQRGGNSGGIELLGDADLHSSVVLVTGAASGGATPAAIAVRSGSSDVSSSTAVALGADTYGVTAVGTGFPIPPFNTCIPSSVDVRITNSVLNGAKGDLSVATTGCGTPGAAVALRSSALRQSTVTQSGSGASVSADASVITDEASNVLGNLFQDPDGSRWFVPKVGAATVDRGAAVDPAITTTDVIGNPRTVGGAADIGAYELSSAPTAGPLVASRVGASSVVLAGPLTFGSGPTSSVRVEYGPTTAYGSSATAAAATAAASGDVAVAGLKPATTYHARLVVTTTSSIVERTTFGPDLTFRTLPAATLLPPTGKLALKLLKRKHQLATTATATCAANGPLCATSTKLTTKVKIGKRTRTLVLGTLSAKVKSGGKLVLTVPLNRTGLALLRTRPTLKLALVHRSTAAGQSAVTLTRAIMWKRPVVGRR